MKIAPIILDIEASGLGARSYPIEIGLALPDDRSYSRLILPEPDWTHWSDEAQAIHHIDRDQLRDKGRPAAEIAGELNELLAGQLVYSDGWANDYSWLALLFDAAGCSPRFRVENLRSLLREDQLARWHPCKDQISADLAAGRHRASTDARILQLAVLRLNDGVMPIAPGHEERLIAQMAELDAQTLSDLIAASRGQRELLRLRERHTALICAGGRILAEHLDQHLSAYVALRQSGATHWEIAAINIHPWYRGTGLYRRMLIRTLAHLLSHGAQTLTSLVLPGSEATVRFHEKLGFVREAESPGQIRYSIRVEDLARRLRRI